MIIMHIGTSTNVKQITNIEIKKNQNKECFRKFRMNSMN